MTVEIFILGLSICSAFTALVTEAIKKMLGKNASYNSNILAAICSVVVAAGTAIIYAVLTKTPVDEQYVVCGILLSLFSWIGAMVGYDKVIQTIKQFTDKKGE